MNERRCSNNDCTISETGICVLGHESAECPYFVSASDDGIRNVGTLGDAPSVVSIEGNRFPASDALKTPDIARLMSNEYCHLVGLIGMPDSGKTACIVSLYLLLAHDKLDGFRFADSKSLVAVDQLSRGARRWLDPMPMQMTSHTKLEDGRSPGFIHLKIRRNSDCTPLHLLISDLPGEWSSALVDSNRADRWGFLRSVDGIWVAVDGQMLTDRVRRRSTIHRTSLLIERVHAFLAPDIPPVHLVVTRLDLSKVPDETIQQIKVSGQRHGIDLSVSHVASFSRSPKIKPGTGLSELVEKTVTSRVVDDPFWPESLGDSNDRSDTLP